MNRNIYVVLVVFYITFIHAINNDETNYKKLCFNIFMNKYENIFSKLQKTIFLYITFYYNH